MSRSGYSDDCDGWAMIRWRGAVTSAIRGKRGQQALRDLLAALDALPEKRLAADALVSDDGEMCALGALGKARGMEMESIDPEDRESVARAFGISEALAAEIMYLNDELLDEYTSINVDIEGPMRPWERHRQLRRVLDKNAGRRRWSYMREWVASQINETPTDRKEKA